MRSLASGRSQKRKRFFKVCIDIKHYILRHYAFVVIVGETPINVTLNNIVSVIPSWGPIYEFTFDMRINKMPEGSHTHTHYCQHYHQNHNGVGMIMRLGADGPTSITRTSLSMAPIVFLGSRKIFICIHNRTNPNEEKRLSGGRGDVADVCGDMCNFEQESFIGIYYLQGLFLCILYYRRLCVLCVRHIMSCDFIITMNQPIKI